MSKKTLATLGIAFLVAGVVAWAWNRYHYRSESVGSGIKTDTNVAPSSDPVVPTNDVVVLAAGDIASCGNSGSAQTAAILAANDGTILVLGDEAYPSGTAQQFKDCYAPTWGKFLDRTRPVPGNHEYLTPYAVDYFSYFGAAAGDPTKGYYSFDLGAWHVVALNSNCDHIGGCGASAPEIEWLKNDLATHPAKCTLAYWHVPRFSSGLHGSNEAMQSLWQTAVEHGVDVVLNGHDHMYERLSPMDADGNRDEQSGSREFVVGTGGANTHYNFGKALATSEARDNTTFGVLKLTLHSSGYDWDFLPVDVGAYADSGSGTCN